jgi:cysteine synthase
VLDTAVYDEVIRVTNDDAMATTRRLAREEAIFVGISSGSTAWAALQLAARDALRGRRIVAILASFGERYLSHPVFTDMPPPDTAGLEDVLRDA